MSLSKERKTLGGALVFSKIAFSCCHLHNSFLGTDLSLKLVLYSVTFFFLLQKQAVKKVV